MNEQDVPRRNKGLFWLGAVIFILLLITVAIYVYRKYDGERYVRQPVNYGKASSNTKFSSAVNDFINWTDSLPDKRMNTDHNLTSTGLIKIANILTLYTGAINDNDQSVCDNITYVRSMSDSVSINWKSGRHADMIKHALTKTASVISETPDGSSPRVQEELDLLKTKIADIDIKTLTLDQRDDVKNAFMQVAVVLKELI